MQRLTLSGPFVQSTVKCDGHDMFLDIMGNIGSFGFSALVDCFFGFSRSTFLAKSFTRVGDPTAHGLDDDDPHEIFPNMYCNVPRATKILEHSSTHVAHNGLGFAPVTKLREIDEYGMSAVDGTD